MWQAFLVAWSMGLLGSLHCVGMCGPLVLSLPVQGLGTRERVWSVGLYHLGRIGIYSFAGLLFGLLGRRVYLAGWQQAMSILLGMALLIGVVGKAFGGAGGMRKTVRPNRFYWAVTEWMRFLWQSPSKGKFFLMGMGNGLLPCGMVYLAVAGALTSPDIVRGVGFMAFFGLGTLPLLLMLQMGGRMIPISFRRPIRRALPYITALVAVLLILRGLNLGIPFISPALAGGAGQVMDCR